MANKILHKCNKPGCSKLTSERLCEVHMAEYNSTRDRYRESAHKRGYNTAWQKSSKRYLIKYPFCAECLKQGIHTPAAVVDHIIPHKGNKKLFWDTNNWQPLCKRCHDRKTATEDGGFGHFRGKIPDGRGY